MIWKEIYRIRCFNEIKKRNRIQISPANYCWESGQLLTFFSKIIKNTYKRCWQNPVFNYVRHTNSVQGALRKEKDQLFHNLSFHYNIEVTGWTTYQKKSTPKKKNPEQIQNSPEFPKNLKQTPETRVSPSISRFKIFFSAGEQRRAHGTTHTEWCSRREAMY